MRRVFQFEIPPGEIDEQYVFDVNAWLVIIGHLREMALSEFERRSAGILFNWVYLRRRFDVPDGVPPENVKLFIRDIPASILPEGVHVHVAELSSGQIRLMVMLEMEPSDGQ